MRAMRLLLTLVQVQQSTAPVPAAPFLLIAAPVAIYVHLPLCFLLPLPLSTYHTARQLALSHKPPPPHASSRLTPPNSGKTQALPALPHPVPGGLPG
jgi:hypothetical protein